MVIKEPYSEDMLLKQNCSVLHLPNQASPEVHYRPVRRSKHWNQSDGGINWLVSTS